MKAVGLHKFGGPEVLRLVDVPEPHAGPGQVRIRVHAAAVNPADMLLRDGTWAMELEGVPAPYVPGMDVAGVVDEIGPDTDTSLRTGDPVMAMLMPFLPADDGAVDYRGGGYVQYAVLSASSVVRAPDGFGHEAAATLPMNGLTALLAFDQLGLPPGSTLAVIGAAGALGGYLVQLAAHAGLTVIADAARADEQLVGELGATEVVPRGRGVVDSIRARYPEGVDAVADVALFGPRLLDAVRDGGTFIRFRQAEEPGGYTAGSTRGIKVLSPFVPEYDGRTDKLDEIRRLAGAGVLTPRVAEVMPAAQASDAHRRLEAGGVRGRFVLTF
ncbi:NADP-dependent oxidoreductase [Catellatospora vulcania]|uniref:NADP-dependent oxidoreductase n=1 Tax=Catellatospora vulcania TaxID=1460450 RepID=UPI0012D4073F|nr:NADP-dependent oxidoreductase [Catellatospora vulcania]